MVRGRLPATLGLSRRARSFAGGHHARGRARGLAVRPCGHARATPAAAAPSPRGDNDPVSAVVSSGKDVRGVAVAMVGEGWRKALAREEGGGWAGGGGGAVEA